MSNETPYNTYKAESIKLILLSALMLLILMSIMVYFSIFDIVAEFDEKTRWIFSAIIQSNATIIGLFTVTIGLFFNENKNTKTKGIPFRIYGFETKKSRKYIKYFTLRGIKSIIFPPYLPASNRNSEIRVISHLFYINTVFMILVIFLSIFGIVINQSPNIYFKSLKVFYFVFVIALESMVLIFIAHITERIYRLFIPHWSVIGHITVAKDGHKGSLDINYIAEKAGAEFNEVGITNREDTDAVNIILENASWNTSNLIVVNNQPIANKILRDKDRYNFPLMYFTGKPIKKILIPLFWDIELNREVISYAKYLFLKFECDPVISIFYQEQEYNNEIIEPIKKRVSKYFNLEDIKIIQEKLEDKNLNKVGSTLQIVAKREECGLVIIPDTEQKEQIINHALANILVIRGIEGFF